jgi:hypothetical protein
MSLMEFQRTFHLIEGKPSMKSDSMLAKFHQIGGKHRWINDGEDGQVATLQLKIDDEEQTCTYSIEQAKQAGLVKPKSNWEKDPGSMLRARVVSRGIRMLRPGIIAGSYTPEEIEDFDNVAPVTSTNGSAKTTKPAAKPVATTTTATSSAKPAPTTDGNVIEAEFSKVDEKPVETIATTKQVAKATDLIDSVAKFDANIQKSIDAHLAEIKLKHISELPSAKIEKLIGSLQAKLSASVEKSNKEFAEATTVAKPEAPASSEATTTSTEEAPTANVAAHSGQSINDSTICSTVQINQINTMFAEIEKKEPDIRQKVMAQIKENKNKTELAQLTHIEASGLFTALCNKAAKLFS